MAAKRAQSDVTYERKATKAETKKYRKAMSTAAEGNNKEAWRRVWSEPRRSYRGVVQGDGNLVVPFDDAKPAVYRGVEVKAKRKAKKK